MDILNRIKKEIQSLEQDIKRAKDSDIKTMSKSIDYNSALNNEICKKVSDKEKMLKGLYAELDDLSGAKNIPSIIDGMKRLDSSLTGYDCSRPKLSNAKLLIILQELDSLLPKARIRKQALDIKSLAIPDTIRTEIEIDFRELMKCFETGCYRAAVIICGRMLEVALHRKYFDVTGNDILETNPGIGLGKLIARLKENEVFFDPGLMDQIHMINKVRIHSVHRKQEVYEPSEEQTMAMMLYTKDIIKRLF